MAAGRCSEAYYTDEWHGYGCNITEGACMFIYPDSKACAEKYGEGPDIEEYDVDEVAHLESKGRGAADGGVQYQSRL